MESRLSEQKMNLFRAPAAARAAKTLDRTLFSRVVPSAAVCVRDNQLISKYRKQLESTRELLQLPNFPVICPNPNLAAAPAAEWNKCLVLETNVKPDEPSTWSSAIQQGTEIGHLQVIPYDIRIDYNLWSYLDIMKSILPEELQDEIPTGFNVAGHVAHLNLRDQYRAYKHIIAQVIVDKNRSIKTVINKIDNVGTENEFRTFAYEVLAGPDDLNVELTEAGCVFRFNYAKVYWNTKLGHEHERIRDYFQPGEVVVDVMAGIGPFAVPAGKKGVFVWANDKNPESYRYLKEAVKRNKVDPFVHAFQADGHNFICQAVNGVLEASRWKTADAVIPAPRIPRGAARDEAVMLGIPRKGSLKMRIPLPPTVAHFVMNLPASAIEFTHNLRGIYRGKEALFEPRTETRLPMVHVHCFAAKTDDDGPLGEICDRLEREIGVRLVPGTEAEAWGEEGRVYIHEVRDVAPSKRMFCASFRVPASVAFTRHL